MIKLPNRGTATNGHEKYLVPREKDHQEDLPSNERGGGSDRMQDDRLLDNDEGGYLKCQQRTSHP